MSENNKRFFIGTDCSGHKYLVPVEKAKEWTEWCNYPEDDERGWDEPEYAQMIEGGTMTFADPKFETLF